MERYTFVSDGYPAVKSDVCYEDQNEDYCGDAIDRLAAYEDTGLEPEEIKACMDGLDEYRKADAEDRLVVLPCKPGDTIFQLRKKSHALGPGVHERHVACITVWGPDEWLVEHGGKTPCRSQDLGKTWFLTREEAEAVLKEETL